MKTKNILRFKNAKFMFHDTNINFLNVFVLSISSGINYLIGKNGSGKSSFLHALSSMYPNIGYSGGMTVDSSNSSSNGFGLISQNPEDSIFPDLTFLENLVYSSLRGFDYLSLGKLVTKKRISEVKSYLNNIIGDDDDIFCLFDRSASQLSGGEKQLLAILMRCYRGSNILLLDEVTANLDKDNTIMVMKLIDNIAENGKIVIFATHQLYLTEEYPGCLYQIQQKNLTKVESKENLSLINWT